MREAEVVGLRLMPATDVAGNPTHIGAGYTEGGRIVLRGDALGGVAYLHVPATSDYLGLIRQVAAEAAEQQ